MNKIKVATHNGFFHADEVFALAVLRICFDKKGLEIEILRTRDIDKIATADIVVDVGQEYNPEKGKFDHHQKNKVADRENGIPYASFGLIWKHFGKEITSEKVIELVDKKLITPIDALDNAMNISTSIFKDINDYSINSAIHAIGNSYSEEEKDKGFDKALEFAVLVLKGEISKAEEKIEGEKQTIDAILKQNEPDILILEKYASWGHAVSKYKNIKLVIFPDKHTTGWCIQTATDKGEGFGTDRVKFPQNWRGLSTAELSGACGVDGSVFCHLGGWFAVNDTKDGALKMAQKTVEIGELN